MTRIFRKTEGGVRHDGETKRQQKSAYLEALCQSDGRLRGEQGAGGGDIRGQREEYSAGLRRHQGIYRGSGPAKRRREHRRLRPPGAGIPFGTAVGDEIHRRGDSGGEQNSAGQPGAHKAGNDGDSGQAHRQLRFTGQAENGGSADRE